jgi:hypothetical protein
LIPPLNEHGYLPPGVHQATLDEVIARFGDGSEERRAEAESLRWLVPLCEQAGITRILINGSFVTDRLEPMDVDVVLLEGPNYRTLSPAADKLHPGLPYLEIRVVKQHEYDFFARVVFGSDRATIPKEVIEVLI